MFWERTPNAPPLSAVGRVVTLAEIQEHLKVDSLAYLSKEGMVEAAKAESGHFCSACFDGNYPIPMDQDLLASKLMLEPTGLASH